MYKSIIPRFILACMVAQAALGTPIKPIQDPPTVSPGSSVSLTCTVNGVFHLCNEGTIESAKEVLEWHIPYLHHSIYGDMIINYGITPFDSFTPQSLTFTPNCIDGYLSSTLTFVANSEFKNTPFQCVLVIDPNHPLRLNSTGLTKLWGQAIALNVNTTSSTCPECSTPPPDTNCTTVKTEPCTVPPFTDDITRTLCQTICPTADGAPSKRSASIFSLVLLLGLLIIMIVNLL